MLDNDIANILNVSFRQNLERLSAFSCSIEAHLTINNNTYGEFDAAWGAATIEHYQAWLTHGPRTGQSISASIRQFR